MLLEIAKPGKRAVAELARVRGCRVASVGVHSDVGVDLWLRRETGRRRGRARRGRLAASPRVRAAILALPRRASGPQRFCNLNRGMPEFDRNGKRKKKEKTCHIFFLGDLFNQGSRGWIIRDINARLLVRWMEMERIPFVSMLEREEV